jgi:hypothetical protein
MKLAIRLFYAGSGTKTHIRRDGRDYTLCGLSDLWYAYTWETVVTCKNCQREFKKHDDLDVAQGAMWVIEEANDG